MPQRRNPNTTGHVAQDSHLATTALTLPSGIRQNSDGPAGQNPSPLQLSRRRPAFPARLLPVLLVLALATGCPKSNDSSKLPGGDPLLHEQYRRADPLVNPLTTTQKQSIPPVPHLPASASNAALAAGQPLPGVKPLQIPQPGTAAATQGRPRTLQPFKTNSPWQADPSRPALSRPVPTKTQSNAEPPTQDPEVRPVAAVKTPAQPVQSFDELLKKMKSRGMSWLRRQPANGGVRLICAFPNPRQPKLLHIYEAVAASPAQAAQAVLRQLDNK